MIYELTKEEADNIPLDQQKTILTTFCCDFIEDNGYVRIGFVIKEIFPLHYFGRDYVSVVKSISALLIESGRYIREPLKDRYGEIRDFDILPNPNYQFSFDVKQTNKSVKRTNNFIWPLTGAIALFSFASAYVAYLQYKKPTEKVLPEIQDIKSTMQRQEQWLDSLRQNSKNVQLELHRLADSLKKK